METKSLMSCLVILMMFCGVSSDFGQDKKECNDQLMSLSPCITFVSGDAKAPNPSCCTELKRNADKSNYCLCVLVRDRNEPGLGFKLNATRAMSLVPICQVNTSAAVCPELLHLPPNSPEAQFFEQLANMSSVGSSTSTGEIVPSSGTKLSVEGIRKKAIIGVFIWISAMCFH